MAQIGLNNLYYATITDAAQTGYETYGTPSALAKAISADISISTNESILYADDGADEIIRDFKEGTITLNIKELGSTVAAALLGVRKDSKGAVVSSGEDEAPYVAIGFATKNAGTGYKYFWLYRVKFSVPSESYKTKGDSIEFATPTITGTFIRRNKPDAANANKHPWKAEIDSAETGADPTTISGWFTTVYEPSAT